MPSVDLDAGELALIKECLESCSGSNANARGMGNVALAQQREDAIIALVDKLNAEPANEGGGRRRKSRKARKSRKGRK